MGQDISKNLYPPPLSFQQCFVDGEFSIQRYYFYRRRRDMEEEDFKLKMKLFQIRSKRKFQDVEPSIQSDGSSGSDRSVKKHKLFVRSDDGTLRVLTPRDTLWYLLYVKNTIQDERLKKIFRTRFRVPHYYFNQLSDDIAAHESFSRWKNSDAVGDNPSNVKLLLLGSLRYLGRSWTFDDIAESNGISREVNRVFFLSFIEYGSSTMYKKYVIDVANSINISNHEKLFSMAGMNGCIGSGDATHISMLNCPSWASISHKGFKLNLPARSYNLTVAHTKLILCSTTGHPATWNDKTLVLYDPLLAGVNDGTKYNDFVFKLYEKNGNGQIKEVEYQGVWFMVDNGYLDWSCTIPPVKNATSYQTIRFSEWLESMRKDVECTFGILKQRFSILRHGVRLGSIKNVDQIWLTCCALHNKLLLIDGMNENWGIGESQSVNHNSENDTNNNYQNFCMTRLNRNLNKYSNDTSSIIHQSIFQPYTVDGKRQVNKMPLDLFRNVLINHFDIRFQTQSVKWPKQFKVKPTSI